MCATDATAMRDVLLVSKPIAPPWTDSNKNLVRDLAGAMRRYRPRVMVPAGASLPGVVSEAVYTAAGAYAPSLLANARVFARLLAGPRVDLWHFFFAPNPLTLRAGAIARAARRVPAVHTIASAPDDLERVAPLLFADAVIALSQHSARRLSAAGVHARVIPPALAPVEVPSAAIEAARRQHELIGPYVLYPGDLEHSDGARTFIEAAALDDGALTWVIAARPKTPRAREALAELTTLAAARHASVRFLGEISDIHAVVAGAALTTLVVDTLHAKMDLPLVLLESLALRVPVVVSSTTAAAEIMPSGGAASIAPGDPAALFAQVRSLFESPSQRGVMGLSGERWVADTCHPSVVAAAHEALYDEVLATRG
jgi:glycosyltransferase involved in cell wall biosynthesis